MNLIEDCDIELILLRGDAIATNDFPGESATSFAVCGDYARCIEYESQRGRFFLPCNNDESKMLVDEFLAGRCVQLLASDDPRGPLDLLSLAVSCLQLFVQNNWTGPPQDFDLYSHLPKCFQNQMDLLKEDVLKQLSQDGQTVYPLTRHPELLFMARCILTTLSGQQNKPWSVDWWLMRCLSVHQQVLDAKSASIKSAVMQTIDAVGKNARILENVYMKVLFDLEAAYICYDFFEYKNGKDYFTSARTDAGLQVDLHGVLGKRTKFQETAISQLILQVKKADHTTEICAKHVPGCHVYVPKNVELNDDTVLETLELNDSDETPIYCISPLESVVVLGLMEDHRRGQADQTLLQEEVSSYVTFLLSQPRVWGVQFTALFRRCRSERSSGRRVDRAMMQMEELKHSYTRASPPAADRLRFFYATRSPTSWMVQCELASLLVSIGAAGAALDIYERLQLWDEAITCCQQLGKTRRAESMIREQLAQGETANLYCFLGDVTGCSEHYEKAWEISGGRSAKAQRCLGYLYLNKQQFHNSLQCFERSLNLNSLQIPVWFTYGCCAMAAQKYDLAVKAFHRCVSLDYDNFEAWSNLATSYVKLHQKEKAFRTLQDAIKCSYDNWRLWENCLIIGTDCGEFRTVINAYHRLIDLKDKWSDVQVLAILVRAVTTDLPDADGQPASRIMQNLLELFGRITAKMTTDPEIWRLYAELTSYLPQNAETQQKRVQYLQRSHRCLCQTKDWEKDVSKCQQVIQISLQLSSAYLEASEDCDDSKRTQYLSSAKLMLKNTLTTIKMQHTDPVTSELRPELREPYHDVSAQLDRVMLQINAV